MPPRAGHGGRGGHGGRRGRRSGGGHGGGEEGGSERWLVTYADMLTLLLVLFIVLFSISVVNTSKFISLKTSLANAFGSGSKGIVTGGTGLLDNDADGTGQQLVMPGNPIAQNTASASAAATGAAGAPTTTPQQQADQQLAAQAQLQDFEAIEKAISKALAQQGLQNSVQFQITARGLVIRVVTDGLLFPGNSADLETTGGQILAAVAPPLGHETRNIEVDGYTNQLNVSTYPYPNGWALSGARAATVAEYLSDHGVPKSQLSAVGYDDQHPLYPPNDPRAATLNRRVEIVVLSSLPVSAGSALPSATPSH
jgi:chemotaxis protein MotB